MGRWVRRRSEAVRAWTRSGANQPLLPLVRRTFLVFDLICLAIIVPQWVLAPVVPQSRSWPVLPALAGLAYAAWRLYRHERPRAMGDVLAAGCLGMVIWAVGALPAGGVLFVGIVFRVLYGGLAGALLALALTITAMTAGVLAAGGSVADVQLGQYGPGLTLTALLLRFVLVVVQRYETGTAARFEAVVRSSRDVIVITDADTVAGFVSPALESVFRLPDGMLPGGRLLSWIVEADRWQAEAWVARLLAAPGSAMTFPCRVAVGDGGQAHVEISAQNLLADPNVGGLLFAVRDVTQRIMLTEKLRHQAFHDPLTGLPNRAMLAERLNQWLSRSGVRVALLLVDLDSFKAVNDTLGHIAGDELLVEVANRLGGCVQPGDTLARLGGDEFAVLLCGGRADPHVAERVADQLLTGMDRPVAVAGQRRRITASIGIAVGTAPVTSDRLMREADVALYRAKGSGKARYVQYRHELHRQAVDEMHAQVELAEALERREFEVHYQPVVELVSGQLAGVEALVRWNRPGRGLVDPGAFVPLTESSGLIVPLGTWVLAEACHQGAAWQQLSGRPLHINVNVSMRQLVQGNVVGDVRDVLTRTGLPPSTLTLEITESALATDDSAIEAQLAVLRQLGVRISLDDFGTGFNSLGYLQQYPVDELKIDKSFVASLRDTDAASLPIITAIMAMSRSLNLRTVAEGIETEGQYAQLAALGVDYGQGYGLSEPLAAAHFEALLTVRSAPTT